MVSPVLLEEDLQSELFGTAALEQRDCAVEVDISARSQTCGVTRRETSALERILTPAFDSVVLVVLPDRCLEGLHALSPRSRSTRSSET
jgi:hypothetical protein